MKKQLYLFALLFFVFSFHPLFSQSADEEAIKEAIKNETRSYFNCDFDTWSSAVLRADYFHFAVTNAMDPGSLAYASGTKFFDYNKKRLQAEDCSPFPFNVKWSDWNIQIRGEVAWAGFKEPVTMPDETVLEARTLKVLEKKDGQWKVAAISAVFDFNHVSKPWNPKGKE